MSDINTYKFEINLYKTAKLNNSCLLCIANENIKENYTIFSQQYNDKH